MCSSDLAVSGSGSSFAGCLRRSSEDGLRRRHVGQGPLCFAGHCSAGRGEAKEEEERSKARRCGKGVGVWMVFYRPPLLHLPLDATAAAVMGARFAKNSFSFTQARHGDKEETRSSSFTRTTRGRSFLQQKGWLPPNKEHRRTMEDANSRSTTSRPPRRRSTRSPRRPSEAPRLQEDELPSTLMSDEFSSSSSSS